MSTLSVPAVRTLRPGLHLLETEVEDFDVRAALLGPSLTVPVADGNLVLGTWQQIVFIDFDNRSRRRNILIQVVGE